MTINNPFVLEKEQYKRAVNPIRHYIEDAAKFLSTMTGDSIEKCTEFVKASLKPGGIFEFKDPNIVYLERENYEDRVEKHGTLLSYINDSLSNQELIAPTLTTYIPPSEKKSILVDFVDENIAVRSRAKKAMFAAKMNGDIDLELFKNSEQSNAKIANNAISGGHVSTSTPLFNRTSHSTLTSNCRSTSGYGNANNEKMLSGNRHYHHPTIVINNIVSISNRTDLAKLEKVMQEYQLHYPTAQEAMKCVLYSTQFYWKSKKQEKVIEELLNKITPLERAAFVYVGDLFHLAMYNDAVVRDFIGSLSTPTIRHYDDPVKIIKSEREEFIALAAQLWPKEMKDITEEQKKEGMKGVEWKKLDVNNAYDFERLCKLAGTMQNVAETLERFRTFIDCFLVSTNLPASLALFPTSIRRSALTSDTDSTIFTVQDWVKWKTNKMFVDDETSGVCAVMIFLAAESITHILATMSANFGIITERIHQVAMKNEYRFDVFVPTQVGKHYFAYIGCQEGNLYIDYEMEIKGVHLKSSNVPAEIMKKAVGMMQSIMDAAKNGEKISIVEKLAYVANIEREIVTAASKGDSRFLRSLQIKSANAYKNEPEKSPYIHYLLWERIFSKKYGSVPPPPYSVFKVPVYLPNARSIESWLKKIQDKHIRDEFAAYFKESGKKSISTLMLPQQAVGVHGIPEEILLCADMRRAVLDCTAVFYIILETLDWHCLDDKISELSMDYYGYDENPIDSLNELENLDTLENA